MEIRVGPMIFKVKTKKTLPPLCEGDEIDYAGQARFFDGTILLKKGLPESLRRETLFHELIHCVMAQGPHELTYEEEEALIRLISAPLLGTLQRNPKVTEYLLGK